MNWDDLMQLWYDEGGEGGDAEDDTEETEEETETDAESETEDEDESEEDDSEESETEEEDEETRFQKWAAERGMVAKKDEVTEEDEDEPEPEEDEEPDFYARAQAEADAKGGKSWEWVQNRAAVLAAEYVADRQAMQQFASSGAGIEAEISQLAIEQFGLAEGDAKLVARDYRGVLTRMAKANREALKDTPGGKALRDVALKVALGDQLLRERAAARRDAGDTGKAPRKVPEGEFRERGTPVTGLDDDAKAFVKQWEKTNNNGKPATKAHIEALKARGAI